jgi:hypothetical protein
MSSVRLPAVGIIIGPMRAPVAVIGLAGRPCDVAVDHWLGQLAERGCHLRVSPVRSFEGTYVECPGESQCELRNRGACPLA